MKTQKMISDLLKETGYSYRKLAKMAEVSRTSISRWHKGVCEPTLRNKHKIETVYMLMQKDIYFPNNDDLADALNYFMMHPIIGNVVNLDDQIKFFEDELAKLKAQKEKEKWKFTEDEKAILRNLPKEYKWIARSKVCQILTVFEGKPFKDDDYWKEKTFCGSRPILVFGITGMNLFSHLFQCIQWEDDEPCEFRKFI